MLQFRCIGAGHVVEIRWKKEGKGEWNLVCEELWASMQALFPGGCGKVKNWKLDV